MSQNPSIKEFLEETGCIKCKGRLETNWQGTAYCPKCSPDLAKPPRPEPPIEVSIELPEVLRTAWDRKTMRVYLAGCVVGKPMWTIGEDWITPDGVDDIVAQADRILKRIEETE